ncbi:MAG: hypothetical protein ACHQZQ_02360 [SAR324 cluster bacterium]
MDPSPTNPNQAKVNDNFSGNDAGFRLVGARFAAAGEYSQNDSTAKPNGTEEYFEEAKAALSLRLGNVLALGVGQTNQSSQTSQTGGWLREQDQIPQYGLSLRLGEWFFLGGAAGQDFVSYTDSVTPKNDFNTSHDVYKYGVGIRTSGTLVTHLEYYVVDFQKYANHTLAHSGKETSSTGVAEFNLGGFLLGYATTHTDQDSNQPAIDSDRIDLGYAPFSGLTVVARGQMDTQKFPQPSLTNTITTTTYAVLVTYLFKT